MTHPAHPTPPPWRTTVTSLMVGAGIATTGGFLAWSPHSPLNVQAIAQTADAPSREVPAPNLATANFVTEVVNDVGPAVVRINASRTVSQQLPDMFSDPFFGGRFNNAPQERTERGVGSGFIISGDGRIITNAHVVDGADRVQVTLKDGRTLEGEVMGSDPVTDVAVIKVNESNLPTVKLSNSDQIQPGEWAIAIGNPLGLDNTVTAGIISGVGRSSSQVGVPDKRVEFIQTDTAINPGNSGGPLLNAQGEVIGVNTAIIRGAQGLGFAIPINTAERIATELAETGTVQHPFLGIQMVTLSPEVKADINNNPNGSFTIEPDEGVLIVRVGRNSPAARSDLRAGDVIVGIEGEAVSESVKVQQIVASGRVGEPLEMTVIRDGETETLAVRPGEFPRQ
ncbi:MAG: HhoA/HhoB/HtrA family serine endopeptidase [Cyanobacteria bacterium P01_A01_bin.105]